MIKLGDKVWFYMGLDEDDICGCQNLGVELGEDLKCEGVVVEIHADHNWFLVESSVGERSYKTGFHFTDINKSLFIKEE